MAMVLDAPPPLPADVKSQMAGGDSPLGGIGQMLKGQADAGGGGALKAQADAIKKLLEKMAQSANAGKSFFSRAMQLIDQGIAVESSKGPGSPAAPSTEMGGDSGASGAPPSPFPG